MQRKTDYGHQKQSDNTTIKRTEIIRKQKWKRKQLYQYFKQQTNEISQEKTWIRLRKRNLKRETESLLIAAPNNVIRIDSISARIDNMRQNSKYRLCSHRSQTSNHIISECSELA